MRERHDRARRLCSAVAVALVGGVLAVIPAAGVPAAAEEPVTRISGADRYATSAAVSAATYDPGVPVAYLATGTDFPDALTGAPAAGEQHGPLLLTRPDTLPTTVTDELTRLAPARIVILGGTSTVSPAVQTALADYTTGPVNRISGADRYATSAAVSRETYDPGVPVAYLATGTDFPDALTGAPAAGEQHGPLLLTRPDTLPTTVTDELTRLAPARIVILGGTSTVSPAVQTALAAYTTGPVTRLHGADRYATSAAVSAATYAPGVPVAYLATGTDFPDALTGAPAAGEQHGPLLLTRPDTLPTTVTDELTRLAPARIVILGGTSTVSPAVQTALAGLVASPSSDTTPPPAVTSASGTTTTSRVTLTWTTPVSTDLTGVVVRRATGTTPPSSPHEGTYVADVSPPSSHVTDRLVGPSTTYSYALFTHDGVPNYGPAATLTVVTGTPLSVRTLTPDGADTSSITLTGGVVAMSAPDTNNALSNLRSVFWRTGESRPTDQGACATWQDASSGLVQEGLALRVRDTPGGATRALTVTKNTIYGVQWVFNVHTWDSSAADPFTALGQFDLSDVVTTPDGYEPLPWRVCARAVGDRFTVKVWLPDREAEPAWDDPVHTRTTTVPAEDVVAGAAGWYVGHLPAGGSAHYTDLLTWSGPTP